MISYKKIPLRKASLWPLKSRKNMTKTQTNLRYKKKSKLLFITHAVSLYGSSRSMIDLLKKLKLLSVEMNKRHNDLLEEAIQDLLIKYDKKSQQK